MSQGSFSLAGRHEVRIDLFQLSLKYASSGVSLRINFNLIPLIFLKRIHLIVASFY